LKMPTVYFDFTQRSQLTRFHRLKRRSAV